MNVVSGPSGSPGVCFICEQTNPVEHVDTFRHFEPGVYTVLSGRKYVCFDCVRDLATISGNFVEKQKFDELEAAWTRAEHLLWEAEHRSEKFAAFAEAWNEIREDAVVQEMKTTKKPGRPRKETKNGS